MWREPPFRTNGTILPGQRSHKTSPVRPRRQRAVADTAALLLPQDPAGDRRALGRHTGADLPQREEDIAENAGNAGRVGNNDSTQSRWCVYRGVGYGACDVPRPLTRFCFHAEQRSICVGTTIGRPLGRSVFPLSHVFDIRNARHSAVRHKCRTLQLIRGSLFMLRFRGL